MPAMGSLVFEVALVLLAANVGIKYAQRRRFLNELYKSRISPEDLHHMLEEGRKVVIVDLRHRLIPSLTRACCPAPSACFRKM